ncbi:MAG: hypothetical protein JXA15_08070 [Spirochaetales bacterium]|nr:hypothetical protein [Spirochaetales bacterium]
MGALTVTPYARGLAGAGSRRPSGQIAGFIAVAALAFVGSSCAGWHIAIVRDDPAAASGVPSASDFSDGELAASFGVSRAEASFRSAVRESALSLVGRKHEEKVVVRGRSFTLDCIGTVSAAYWGAGVDVTVDFPKYEGNGVARLHQSLRDRRALESDREPAVGDAIFWDDTWDRDGDGRFGNDPLTHSGIVVQVDADGTIHYLHDNYFYGVTVERMNLRRPADWKDESGKVINSPLYMASYPGKKGNPPRFLAGDLFKAYGSAEGIRKGF